MLESQYKMALLIWAEEEGSELPFCLYCSSFIYLLWLKIYGTVS